LLAFALWKSGDPRRASALARENLRVDPLDAFARAMVVSTGFAPAREALDLGELVRGKEQAVLDLATQFLELAQEEAALEIIERFYIPAEPAGGARPIPRYWAAYLSGKLGRKDAAERYLREARALSSDAVFPHRIESVPILRWALEVEPKDGKAALYLGHLLFSLGRHGEGRECWMKAADLGESPAVALRALGMAALELDGDRPAAAKHLERAHAADPEDPIVARDLAKVIFSLAEKEDSAERKKELFAKARDTLAAAFPAGKGRSDFVALLARARSRLGEFAETAKLLDSVRITIWEGAREAHDLFEEAHLELGKAHLEAGRAAEALAEFDRALEYPVNLATGKLENTREAHIHYLRGNALSALGRKDAAIEAWKKAADEPASDDSKKEDARKKAREALDAASGGR
jgi:tetratricopeptide (TPR) repeat protein